jgi:RecB family endonuclease NucS
MNRRNLYRHTIELIDLDIPNKPREEFRQELEKIPYRGYTVEQISDGRRIVITKPGGKFVFGHKKREDIMVWVYNPGDDTLWLISHKDIFNDIEEKAKNNHLEALKIIKALEFVFNGEEPDSVLQRIPLSNSIGENPEVFLKAYKWIWGQEDCNYPGKKGRQMSMDGLLELKARLLVDGS